MGKFLHTLGVFAYRHKWRVLAGWFILLVILAGAALAFIKPTSSAISIPGTAAQTALDRVNELFPGAGRGTGRVVFEAPKGKTLLDYRTQIADGLQKIATVDGVLGVVGPFDNPGAMSKDHTIGYAQLQLRSGNGEIRKTTTEAIAQYVSAMKKDHLVAAMGGDVIDKAPGEILGIGEVAGVALALVVLVLTLGSLVAAGMPLVIALMTIGVSMAGLFALSQVIDISATTPVLAVMLGLAVGIDYSLFIISKYKHYLLEGYGYDEAAGKATGTAGNAVIFAAATVVIALSALTIVRIPFMTTMGLAGAATVGMAAIVAVTLVPALLGFAKDKVFSGKTKRAIAAAQAGGVQSEPVRHATIWFRWGEAITGRPIVMLIVGLVIIGVIAWPAQHLRLGLPTDEYAAKTTTERQAYDLLGRGFGAGFNGPLIVVVEGLPAVPKAAQAMPYANLYELQKVATKIGQLTDVAEALPAKATVDGTKGIIQVIARSAPSDSQTSDLISYLRSPEHQKELTGSSAVSLAVTGATALQGDINDKLAAALPLYLAVVVGLSLLLLIVAFRSILVPLKATLGFLLSVVAMFGALVAVFQWGWFGVAAAPGPIVSFIPIIAIGILFGLAMDYEFFLVSSMHEAYERTGNAKRAVVDGFGLGSKVVTAAGVIMVSVFAGFITNHDATIQAIGFGLAVGILVDAFIVRMTIVPAVMVLLGKSAWWLPRWLGRLLPHISIEGEEDDRTIK